MAIQRNPIFCLAQGAPVLLSAIRNAIDRSKTGLGHEAEMQALRDRYESLTRREREVMALVASGQKKTSRWGARHQRDHGEGTPRPGDAENEGRLLR